MAQMVQMSRKAAKREPQTTRFISGVPWGGHSETSCQKNLKNTCPELVEGIKKFLAISPNVRDIRSFSVTKRKKNLGEGRAEPRTVYPLLYEGERNTVERKRSVPLRLRVCRLLF